MKRSSESDTEYQRTFDPETADVCRLLCRIIAVYENTPQEALPPLADALDPDALAAFFRTRGGSSELTDRSIRFTYAGYDVRIDSEGILTLAAAPPSPE